MFVPPFHPRWVPQVGEHKTTTLKTFEVKHMQNNLKKQGLGFFPECKIWYTCFFVCYVGLKITVTSSTYLFCLTLMPLISHYCYFSVCGIGYPPKKWFIQQFIYGDLKGTKPLSLKLYPHFGIYFPRYFFFLTCIVQCAT